MCWIWLLSEKCKNGAVLIIDNGEGTEEIVGVGVEFDGIFDDVCNNGEVVVAS